MINSTICRRINECQQKAHLKWNDHHHHVLVDRNGLYETVVLAKGIHNDRRYCSASFSFLLCAVEWTNERTSSFTFFWCSQKKHTQRNCVVKMEHLQMFMSIYIIAKYVNCTNVEIFHLNCTSVSVVLIELWNNIDNIAERTRKFGFILIE